MEIFKFKVLFLFVVFPLLGYSQFDKKTDSLIKACETMQKDSLLVDNYNLIFNKTRRKDRKLSLSYAEKAVKLAKEISYKKGEALAYKNIGNSYFWISDYNTAFKNYSISLDIYKGIKDKKGIAILLRNIGSVYSQNGKAKEALNHFHESLKLRKEIGDKKGIASLYRAIGLLYSQQNDEVKEKSRGYFLKSLKIYQDMNDYRGVAKVYLYLGSIQVKKDSALKYYKSCIKIADSLSDRRLQMQVHDAISVTYLNAKDFERALKHINIVIELSEKLKNKYMLAGAYFSLGKLYKSKNQFKLAIEYYNKSLSIAGKINAKNYILNSYSDLYGLYRKQNLSKTKMLFYLEKYVILKDAIQKDEMDKAISKYEIQMSFNNMIKEKEMNVQKKELEYTAQINQQKIYTASFVVFSILMLILVFFVFRSLNTKKKSNKLLTEKNTHISEQNDILQQKNIEIEQQSKKLQKQHKEIIDSINYAQRIQKAILPSSEYLTEILNEHFVLFKPRDIVSGDFYWAKQFRNISAIAVADCTGHGVPGAFMSMLGSSFLNELVTSKKINEPGHILDRLRSTVKSSLNQKGVEGEQKDGMDIGFIVVNNETMQLSFSGAYNSLIIIRNNELIQLKADRQPIGIFIKEKPFTTKTFKLHKGDTIYSFSDGYPDQFGGPSGHKFKINKFRKLLLEISESPMREQRTILDKKLTEWRGEISQIDDVLVFGIRV